MAKVKFQTDGVDSNLDAEFNGAVRIDGSLTFGPSASVTFPVGTLTAGAQGITGTQGIQGVTGTSFTYRGTYNSGAQYYVNHVVSYNGSTWICIQTIDGVAPAENTWWTLFTAQGTTGAQGSIGTQGTLGTQGTIGTTGIQGTTGTQGLIGLQGNIGIQGFTGSNGLQGTQGVQGFGFAQLQGTQGTTGLQGTSGTPAAQIKIDSGVAANYSFVDFVGMGTNTGTVGTIKVQPITPTGSDTGKRIYTGTVTPSGATAGDIWIDATPANQTDSTIMIVMGAY